MSKSTQTHFSACPHDCPSTCALEVERESENRIGRIRGARDNSYTSGVICEKVARYAERAHHPDRLLTPMRRKGSKGSGEFQPISWDDALDETAEAFLKAEQKHGPETVWPYYYAGTMGLVMRDGINRLRHTKRYSGMHGTICVTPAWTGYIAGTGKLMGADPREMAVSDQIIIWGTNPVNTQINVMTHVTKARKERGAKIIVIDTYRNDTAKKADLFLCVRPGTDGALACGVMHVLFRDGYADRKYLDKFTDVPADLEQHLSSRTPQWASDICGVSIEDIETFARMIGETPKTYFRLGYGFTRSRNGATNMHAATCIAAITGAWKHEGGGAFHNNGAIYHWDKTLIEGQDQLDPSVRVFDQSRIGAVLCGDESELKGGPPVTALFIQNTNPMSVAPDLSKVHQGFARDDLFICVHEQFMTETAQVADIVLPATMFVEHDDLYQGGGHQHILFGPKIIDGPEGCRSNHEVICELAKKLGAEHPGFNMTPRELIDATLSASGWGNLKELESNRWIDCQPPFEEAHYSHEFQHSDGKFHFKPDWKACLPHGYISQSLLDDMPGLPDHWNAIDEANADKPFRLVTAPARTFLNSTFNETPSSLTREGRPETLIHPEDAAKLSIADGQRIEIGNKKGSIFLHARHFDGVQRGVVISEGIWPNHVFEGGIGINILTSADAAAPNGGAPFHDTAIWIKPA
ncbi:MAG: molybdopterin oxidoreductase family protein [Rhodospirillales bacterium]|nr:molybdopterin oxidoreductase family protein [Rhodospirillales bacterium]